jgi:hypothetical protein
MRPNQQQQNSRRDLPEGDRDHVQEPQQDFQRDNYVARGGQEADHRGRDQVRQVNQRRGGFNNQRFNRSRSRDPHEVCQNSNWLGAIVHPGRSVGLALRAEPNQSSRDRWAHRSEMREVDSDNSANNLLREFNHRSSQINQSTTASNVNVRNNEDQDAQRQQNWSPRSNHGNPNAVIPERLFNSEKIEIKFFKLVTFVEFW